MLPQSGSMVHPSSSRTTPTALSGGVAASAQAALPSASSDTSPCQETAPTSPIILTRLGDRIASAHLSAPGKGRGQPPAFPSSAPPSISPSTAQTSPRGGAAAVQYQQPQQQACGSATSTDREGWQMSRQGSQVSRQGSRLSRQGSQLSMPLGALPVLIRCAASVREGLLRRSGTSPLDSPTAAFSPQSTLMGVPLASFFFPSHHGSPAPTHSVCSGEHTHSGNPTSGGTTAGTASSPRGRSHFAPRSTLPAGAPAASHASKGASQGGRGSDQPSPASGGGGGDLLGGPFARPPALMQQHSSPTLGSHGASTTAAAASTTLQVGGAVTWGASSRQPAHPQQLPEWVPAQQVKGQRAWSQPRPQLQPHAAEQLLARLGSGLWRQQQQVVQQQEGACVASGPGAIATPAAARVVHRLGSHGKQAPGSGVGAATEASGRDAAMKAYASSGDGNSEQPQRQKSKLMYSGGSDGAHAPTPLSPDNENDVFTATAYAAAHSGKLPLVPSMHEFEQRRGGVDGSGIGGAACLKQRRRSWVLYAQQTAALASELRAMQSGGNRGGRTSAHGITLGQVEGSKSACGADPAHAQQQAQQSVQQQAQHVQHTLALHASFAMLTSAQQAQQQALHPPQQQASHPPQQHALHPWFQKAQQRMVKEGHTGSVGHGLSSLATLLGGGPQPQTQPPSNNNTSST